ncbi:unnamed protein product, partial [Arabidopsis halleri]
FGKNSGYQDFETLKKYLEQDIYNSSGKKALDHSGRKRLGSCKLGKAQRFREARLWYCMQRRSKKNLKVKL